MAKQAMKSAEKCMDRLGMPLDPQEAQPPHVRDNMLLHYHLHPLRYGSFPKEGDSNIDPNMLESLLWGDSKWYL